MSDSISLSREKARERVSSGKFLFFLGFLFFHQILPFIDREHTPTSPKLEHRISARWGPGNGIGTMGKCDFVPSSHLFPFFCFSGFFHLHTFSLFLVFTPIFLSLPSRNDGACYFSFLKMNINLPFHIFLSVCSGGIRAKHREVFSYFLSQNL